MLESATQHARERLLAAQECVDLPRSASASSAPYCSRRRRRDVSGQAVVSREPMLGRQIVQPLRSARRQLRAAERGRERLAFLLLLREGEADRSASRGRFTTLPWWCVARMRRGVPPAAAVVRVTTGPGEELRYTLGHLPRTIRFCRLARGLGGVDEVGTMVLILRAVSTIIVVLLPSVTAAQARVERNVVYGMYSGTALLLDVHYPATSNGRGIVFVAGSGWTANPPAVSVGPNKLAAPEYRHVALKDMEQTPIWVPPLTAAGYTVFVPNHRATPAFHYPAPLEDVQRAVRFVRHHASAYGIDAERIGGIGGSSGAHLIAMTATLDDRGMAGDPDPINRLSAKVQAVVLRAAPTDLTASRLSMSLAALFQVSPSPTTSAKGSALWKRLAQASPLRHVSRDDPPTLLIHGDADEAVDYQQSMTFVAALQKHGVASRLVTIPGGTHSPTFTARNSEGVAEFAPRPPHWPDYFAETVRWFDQYLKAGTATN
jgi:acetyl esterase/lipase